MKKPFRVLIYVLFMGPFIGLANPGDGTDNPPSVERTGVICDRWQFSNVTMTWSCLTQPREVSVAHGATTDQVVQLLEDQIRKLDERIKKLEGH